ncbi:MAG: hypothetical protein JJV99_09850, partial [Colwellia sp.]|nr:hypothetical protein [Colwellia sp.]
MKKTAHFTSKPSLNPSLNLCLNLIFITLITSLLFSCANNENTKQTKASVALPVGMSLVKTVVKTEDRLAIPFKKYTLANGLTVILHQDNSDPLVHVD